MTLYSSVFLCPPSHPNVLVKTTESSHEPWSLLRTYVPMDAEAKAGPIVLYVHDPHSYMVCRVIPSVPLSCRPPPASHPLTPQVSVCDPLGLFVASCMTPSQHLAHGAELVPLPPFCTGEMRLRGSEPHPWPPKSFRLVSILFNCFVFKS